jgi:hypothetical protein
MDVDVVPPKTKPFGRLVVCDLVQQEAAWTRDLGQPWDGITLATAGNLVSIGTAAGRLVAYNAATRAASGGNHKAAARTRVPSTRSENLNVRVDRKAVDLHVRPCNFIVTKSGSTCSGRHSCGEFLK